MPIVPIEDQVASYRYLRIALVGLLLALGAAVSYQRSQQGYFLGSVSGYYYTPAQAVVVGALIGVGASMLALRGMNEAEDAFLNLGGIFAIGVAIVPTGRGPDFLAAVTACQKLTGTPVTQRASNLDCPTVQALENAAREGVKNSMIALLITGGLALVLAVFLLIKGWRTQSGSAGRRAWVLGETFVALLLWVGAAIALRTSVDWTLTYVHHIATVGLAACILLVVAANAYRRRKKASEAGAPKSPWGYLHNRYSWIAGTMLIVAAVMIVLWLAKVISLFWVEISVAVLFVVFWTVQTIELEVESTRLTSATKKTALPSSSASHAQPGPRS
jgi:hypothetical protein